MSDEYSNKERKLLNWFEVQDQIIDSLSISAPGLYRIAIENAFLDDYYEGRETESLKRCGRAMRDCSAYRLTPEWDAMIDIE